MSNVGTPTAESVDAPAPTAAQDSPPIESLYRSLSLYPFDTDQEYLAGLSAILGHPETPPTPGELSEKDDLVQQARSFYFSRKFAFPPIDPASYSSWLASQQQPPTLSHPTHVDQFSTPPTSTHLTPTLTATASSSVAVPDEPPVPSTSTPASTEASQPEPPYPTSFAAIVDLIVRNVPVPGIEEIPTTVLEPGTSKVDKTPRRKKPWEKDSELGAALNLESSQRLDTPLDRARDADDKADDVVDINGHKETGQGVVNILKPNAIPDSGLLSQD